MSTDKYKRHSRAICYYRPPLGWETFLPGHLHAWLLVTWLAPSFGLVLFVPTQISFSKLCLIDWTKQFFSTSTPDCWLCGSKHPLWLVHSIATIPRVWKDQLNFDNMMHINGVRFLETHCSISILLYSAYFWPSQFLQHSSHVKNKI